MHLQKTCVVSQVLFLVLEMVEKIVGERETVGLTDNLLWYLFNPLPHNPVFELLTNYQTTNFRLFQTEGVCRRQFQIL